MRVYRRKDSMDLSWRQRRRRAELQTSGFTLGNTEALSLASEARSQERNQQGKVLHAAWQSAINDYDYDYTEHH